MWTIHDQTSPRVQEIYREITNKEIPEIGIPEEFWNKCYKKDPNLLNELIAICRNSFPTFCSVLLKVVPKGKSAQPFIFNRPQRMIWEVITGLVRDLRPVFLVVLKARQLGVTTFFASWLFWKVWRFNNTKAMVIESEVKIAENVIAMMRLMFESLPNIKGVKPALRKGSHHGTIPRSEVYFSDRMSSCSIHVAKNVSPIGIDHTQILEDEKAFYENAQVLDAALEPQLPARGSPQRLDASYIVASTPKGENFFFEEYINSEPVYPAQRHWGEEVHAEAKALFFPWCIHDEPEFGGYAIPIRESEGFHLDEDEEKIRTRLSKVRALYGLTEATLEQMKWRRETLNQKPYFGDEELFYMHYPENDIDCFRLSSDSAFKHLMRYLGECVDQADERAEEAWKADGVKTKHAITGRMSFDLPQRDGIETKGRLEHVRFEPGGGPFTVWEPPVTGEQYAAFLDPSNGIPGGNKAAICVLSVSRCRQVAEWADHANPMRAVDMLCAIGQYYNWALINAELNIHQWTILERCDDRRYGKQYRWMKWDELKPSKKYFWETTSKSRSQMFNTMVYWLDERMVGISSKYLLSELSTFERTVDAEDDDATGNPQMKVIYKQQRHAPDDRTMAFCGAIMTVKQAPKGYRDNLSYFSQFPSSQQLGLQGSKRQAQDNNWSVEKLEEAAKKSDDARELMEKLTGGKQFEYTWNPVRDEFGG